ncbi:MAG: ABC transporter ATP-binding protein [Clostridiales bacterium]|nr:MAG: ABC transporter ATP-binding protein [Clostridiales bacterium]
MIAIKTTDLIKKYKNKIAVNGLNVEIFEGEIFGLLGVNGAGKTTTIKMLSCLSDPTLGDAVLLGDSVITKPQSVKEKIGVSPQETAVARNLSVYENLVFTAQIYGFNKIKAQEKALQMISIFGLEDKQKAKTKTLSGGTARRLSIAMALISEPKILFLDEPTLGLDVLARRELWNEIKKLKGKITIILTTHYMEEAQSLCDRIGIMANGKLVDVGTTQELITKTSTENFEDAFIKIAGGVI